MKLLVATALVLTALGTASADAATVPTVKVFYGDLELASPAGMTTLNSRIHRAARAVCSNSEGLALADRALNAACYRTAVAGAMSQVQAKAPQFASR